MLQMRQHHYHCVAASQRQNSIAVDITSNGLHLPASCSAGQKWAERWCTLADSGRELYEQVYEFEVRDDDVFVVTFPKCGTTWVQEAAWLLLNNLNYEAARSQNLGNRSVFMELSAFHKDMPRNTVEESRKLPSPRLLKSHLPAHLLPHQIWTRKAKLVYCARNLKDVIVSFYHFTRGMGSWKGSNIDEFIADFIAGDVNYTPYWASILDFWRMREEPNVFFTTYEQLQRDLPSVLNDLCEFLQRPALSAEQLSKLVTHLSFDEMRANKRTNPTEAIKTLSGREHVLPGFEFMRRGIVGAYKDELSAESQQRLEMWTQQCLQGCQLTASDIFGEV